MLGISNFFYCIADVAKCYLPWKSSFVNGILYGNWKVNNHKIIPQNLAKKIGWVYLWVKRQKCEFSTKWPYLKENTRANFVLREGQKRNLCFIVDWKRPRTIYLKEILSDNCQEIRKHQEKEFSDKFSTFDRFKNDTKQLNKFDTKNLWWHRPSPSPFGLEDGEREGEYGAKMPLCSCTNLDRNFFKSNCDMW